MSPTHVSAKSPTHESMTVEDWLQWFATEKQAACRAYLCTRYHLDALDADALINDALLQVVRYWASLENPLAYLWQTLRHAVAKQVQRHSRERQQLAVYAQQQRLDTYSAAHTAEDVTSMLAQVSPHQQCLLTWYAQGYGDAQVAAWLGTTPQAVRVARHGAYRTLRAQLGPSSSRHRSRLSGEE